MIEESAFAPPASVAVLPSLVATFPCCLPLTPLARAGLPRAGELTAAGCTPAGVGGWALPGDGTEFNLRSGPDYTKFGKKAPSAENIYELIGADAFKRSKGQARNASPLLVS